jgi:hypothetical protein
LRMVWACSAAWLAVDILAIWIMPAIMVREEAVGGRAPRGPGRNIACCRWLCVRNG